MTEDKAKELQCNIAILEKEAGFIDRKLDRLVAQKKAIQTAIFARKAQFAPIRCLPPETLTEIFSWAVVPEHPDDPHRDEITTTRIRLLLVCRTWRDSMLASPPFWSRLSLLIRRTYKAKEVAKLGKLLVRSQPGTLDLGLSVGDRYRFFAPRAAEVMNVVMDTVAPHLQRCSRIYLHLPQQHISRLLLPQGTVFQWLRHLTLTPMHCTSPQSLLVDFTSYPQLEVLNLESHGRFNIAFRGVCPSLREIMVDLRGNEIEELLQCSPFITNCKLKSLERDTLTRGEAILQFPHLTKLMTVMSTDLVRHLLSRLRLPSLQELTLNLSFSSSHEPLLIDFIYFPQLEVLDIAGSDRCNEAFRGQCTSLRDIRAERLSGDQVLGLLECSPSITTCKLTARRLDDTLAGAEAILQLPHLTKLAMAMSVVFVEKLLDRLFLPSLQMLTLSRGIMSSSYFTPEDPLHLERFFRRSCPPLTDLEVQDIAFDGANLISLLPLIPSLRSFIVVRNIRLRDHFFHALTLKEGNVNDSCSRLCPELTELRIYDCPRANVSVTAVGEMVLSRFNGQNDTLLPCKPLKVLDLSDLLCGDDAREEMLCYPGLDRCIETGLNITVRIVRN